MDVKDESLEEIIETKVALNLEIDHNELRWEQRAKADWFRYGDRNTRFFHNFATYRRKMNSVKVLKYENNVIREDVNEKLGVAVRYFQGIFESKGCLDVAKIYNAVGTKVSHDMSKMLLVDFTVEVVGLAIKEMGVLKAP